MTGFGGSAGLITVNRPFWVRSIMFWEENETKVIVERNSTKKVCIFSALICSDC